VRDTTLGRVGQETGRIFLDEMDIAPREFSRFKQVRIIACGTSWHAGQAGKFMIERLARIPVEVDYGSEFRYRDPIVSEDTLTVVISQSGETADTLAAQREAKSKGSKTLAICNVVGSMITREAAGTIYTHAGPEIGVASTKAFTCQLTALFILAMYLGQSNGRLDEPASRCLVQELLRLPAKIETVLAHDRMLEELARHLFRSTDFLFLGRGIHYPIALEGALKLKEISYIHAEGYPAGEMKHGPNALIDEKLPVVVIATRDGASEESRILYEKTLSNIQEVKAREGIVVAVATEGDEEVGKAADYLVEIPPSVDLLAPIVEIVPLQLLAYHIAVRRGCDVDQPRNLAITGQIEAWLRERRSGTGLLTVFVQHTSASLIVQENADPDVVHDLNGFFERLAPERGPYRHTVEGPDDMPAHIRAALTLTQISIPVEGGRMALGTWQGVYLFEHRSSPHRRTVLLHLLA
jgi:glucosamine--fructose-6-phosphate aminotransferase (isomerizing)